MELETDALGALDHDEVSVLGVQVGVVSQRGAVGQTARAASVSGSVSVVVSCAVHGIDAKGRLLRRLSAARG
ncbi:hypothetical protein [Nocardia sp. CA-119907]|uniref:hypothetical protein n=1 Tax=Nocardia sp. CA-119907 TaxID=3239973 RepID=UPI003D99EE17